MTGWEGGIGIGVDGVVALTTRPLERRDFTLRPGPSARQRARPAALSERYGGLWRRFFSHDRAPALQVRPSLLSTSHNPGSSPCGSPAATALGLFPRGTATTGEVGAPTRDESRCVTAVLRRVSEALAVLALQSVFGGDLRFHRHSEAAEFGERSYFRHLRT